MFQIRWVWSQLKGYRVRYVLALCSTVVLSSASIWQNQILANIVDKIFEPLKTAGVVTDGDVHHLIMLCLGLVCFVFLRTTLSYISVITYESCSQKTIYNLRNKLYVTMQHQDMDFYSKNRTGNLMTILTGDMDMIRHTLCFVMRFLIDSIVIFAFSSCLFIYKDPLFALSLLVVTPFIFLVTMLFSKKIGPYYVTLRDKLSKLNICVQENISGNKVVKAFAREKYEIEKFEEKNKEYKDANLKASLLWYKYQPYINILSQSLWVAVLLVGGLFLIKGRITLGTYVLFNSLCWTLTNPMKMIGMLLNDFQRFLASCNKIIELFYSRSTIDDRNDAIEIKGRIKGNVEFKHVSLVLNDTKVLQDINLKIDEGETVAIMGSTGSGKTSLINLIPRFIDTTEGEVLIDGIPVNRIKLQKLRSSIGIANQDVFLFSDTIDGNIAYGNSSMSEEKVADYAKRADVNFVENMEQGFNTVIGERGTGLSGGQKQRIALARALAVEPSILILDDTTSAVDLETEKYIQNQLDNLPFSCTKIIVAQRISTTKRADLIVVLEKGKVVDVGTHDELISHEGYYKEVYDLQNGE